MKKINAIKILTFFIGMVSYSLLADTKESSTQTKRQSFYFHFVDSTNEPYHNATVSKSLLKGISEWQYGRNFVKDKGSIIPIKTKKQLSKHAIKTFFNIIEIRNRIKILALTTPHLNWGKTFQEIIKKKTKDKKSLFEFMILCSHMKANFLIPSLPNIFNLPGEIEEKSSNIDILDKLSSCEEVGESLKKKIREDHKLSSLEQKEKEETK